MKKFKDKINFIVEMTNTGCSAYSEKHGIYSTGENIASLMNNVLEASILRYEDEYEITPDNIKYEVDFKQFFKFNRVINAKYLAERVGVNPSLLSQYVSGKKKPSSKQTEKILLGINQIGRELVNMNLLYQ